jgi:hypothetical protein
MRWIDNFFLGGAWALLFCFSAVISAEPALICRPLIADLAERAPRLARLLSHPARLEQLKPADRKLLKDVTDQIANVPVDGYQSIQAKNNHYKLILVIDAKVPDTLQIRVEFLGDSRIAASVSANSVNMTLGNAMWAVGKGVEQWLAKNPAAKKTVLIRCDVLANAELIRALERMGFKPLPMFGTYGLAFKLDNAAP